MSLTKVAAYQLAEQELAKEANRGNVGPFRVPPQQNQGRKISSNSAANFSRSVTSGRGEGGNMQKINEITQHSVSPENFSMVVLQGHATREVGP